MGDNFSRMTTKADCLFCGVVAGSVPADLVARGERAVAFRDINPQAPTHVLVIPTDHYENAAELAAADPEMLAEVFTVADDVARAEGLAESGYRSVFNTGAGVGQSVFHAHLHVLGGRAVRWPPG